MKTPKARQLPSGSWFVRVRMDGRDIGITKPTEKEAVAAAMAVKACIVQAARETRSRTLTAAIDSYIDARMNVCSPSTIAGYRKIQRTRFGALMSVQMVDNTIRRNLQKISEDAGLPYVGLHGLRHSFASLAYHLGLVSQTNTFFQMTIWLKQQTPSKVSPEMVFCYTAYSQRESVDFK